MIQRFESITRNFFITLSITLDRFSIIYASKCSTIWIICRMVCVSVIQNSHTIAVDNLLEHFPNYTASVATFNRSITCIPVALCSRYGLHQSAFVSCNDEVHRLLIALFFIALRH